MRNRLIATVTAGLVSLSLAGCSALGNNDKKAGVSDGVTDTSISFGNSIAYSGPASTYSLIAKAAQAYFKSVNDAGGVPMGDGHTRKVKFTSLDDAFNPSRTLQNAKQLIDKDKVFGLFAVSGTAPNLAIWDYTSSQKVPQVFCGGGFTLFSSPAHPNVIGFQPTYAAETTSYAEYLRANKPNAKVAILYQDDGLGQSYLDTLTTQVKGSKITIVGKQSYAATDVNVASQIAKLKDTGADTLLLAAAPKFAAQAIGQVHSLGWHPVTFLSAASASVQSVLEPAGTDASQGIITAAYLKDPADPQWSKNTQVTAYKTWAHKWAPALDADNYLVAYGYTVAQALVETLKQMKKPTRQALTDQINHLDFPLALLLPGIKVHATPSARFPIQSLQLERFSGTRFQLIGNVLTP